MTNQKNIIHTYKEHKAKNYGKKTELLRFHFFIFPYNFERKAPPCISPSKCKPPKLVTKKTSVNGKCNPLKWPIRI